MENWPTSNIRDIREKITMKPDSLEVGKYPKI